MNPFCLLTFRVDTTLDLERLGRFYGLPQEEPRAFKPLKLTLTMKGDAGSDPNLVAFFVVSHSMPLHYIKVNLLIDTDDTHLTPVKDVVELVIDEGARSPFNKHDRTDDEHRPNEPYLRT